MHQNVKIKGVNCELLISSVTCKATNEWFLLILSVPHLLMILLFNIVEFENNMSSRNFIFPLNSATSFGHMVLTQYMWYISFWVKKCNYYQVLNYSTSLWLKYDSVWSECIIYERTMERQSHIRVVTSAKYKH